MTDQDRNSNNTNADDNVVAFTPRKKPEVPKPPPMINLPLATKILAGAFILIHVFLWAGNKFIFPGMEDVVLFWGGFTPAAWAGASDMPFTVLTILTPVTYAFLHGSLMHVAVNTLMTVAIGSGVEKMFGLKRFLILFFAPSVLAAAITFAFSPMSPTPLIGASGGTSGLFGAMMVMIYRMQQEAGQPMGLSFRKFVLLWVGLMIVTGLIGSMAGPPIGWIAHIGGFLAGIGFSLWFLKRNLTTL
jgi:membrane associated rhomboid family serine protease